MAKTKAEAKYCAGCGQPLVMPGAERCSACGAKQGGGGGGGKGRRSAPAACGYAIGKLTCPLPGTHAAAGGSAPSVWYCWLHRDSRPQGLGAEHDLQRIASAAPQLLALRRREGREVGGEVEAQITAHPEWGRAEGESREDYARRMFAWYRVRLAELRERVRNA